MSKTIVPAIICGGFGTRLWPVSRRSFPKQFVAINGDLSTFQQTVLRVAKSPLFSQPVIVASYEHRFLIRRQLDVLKVDASIILEPEARDSGPAMLSAAVFQHEVSKNDNPVLFLAADHHVSDTGLFIETCEAGLAAASLDHIVTFGVPAHSPSTQYGYIQAGSTLGGAAFRVNRFIEKPQIEDAKKYQAEGFLWNSGNFMARPSVMIAEYNSRSPQTVTAVEAAVKHAGTDLGFTILDGPAFGKAEKQSIDYAVMEHTKRAAVVKAKFDWSDLGSWNAYWDLAQKDDNGNAFNGAAEAVDSHDCYALSEDALVTLLGVKDLVVVATRDAILIAHKDRTQDVKTLVNRLKAKNNVQVDEHVRCYRPWGWYQSLDSGSRFQVKRIVVYPGGRLSLQKHFHRAEHWVVVRGTALITNGEASTLLKENESTYIPLGHVHRLENPGKIDLELIEVQSGSYLGEDDIVRLEDVYSRS